MSNRREFLRGLGRATAGSIFGGCALVDSAVAFMQAATQRGASGKRREVVVGGRRVRVIDVDNHISVPDIWKVIPKDEAVPAMLEQQAKNFHDQPTLFNPRGRDVDTRLADMDEMGIDVQAVSINASYYWAEPELALRIVQIQNEKIAELCVARPDRFVGLGSVTLQHPVLAVEQLEQGVKKLGMRGFLIGGSINGEELSSLKFHPFWAKAEQLGTLIFIHPQGFNHVGDQLKGQPRFGGNGLLSNVIGQPLETTIALSHLIQEGTLDRFPGLKICAAHGGGYLPSYAGRNDQCLIAFPEDCKPLKKLPREYLKQLYYDSILFTPEAMRHLIAEVGASQVVLGTDYATRWNRNAVDRILEVPGMSEAQQIAMLGGTLAKLLRVGL